MIVLRTGGGSRLVTQADHARLSAEMLRLFRLPELVGHPRRELLLRAVREHDNGWWEADSAPRRDPSGATAVDFRAIPPDLRQEIWQRGIERFAADEPYLAALLAAHALRLLRSPREESSRAAFHGQLAERLAALLEAAGESPESVARDDSWMALADGLSLAACTGDGRFVDRPGWRAEVVLPPADANDEGARIDLGLAPFPLAGTTSFALPCRELAGDRFASDSALGVALLCAPWRRLRVRVHPL